MILTAMTADRLLITSRLELRPHAASDYDDMLALWSDPAVTRFIGGKPSTEDEVWTRLLKYGGLWSLLGLGYWVVRERSNGAFVGELGFARFRRGLGPDFDDAPEAGWVLAPHAQGKGYALEALTAALWWAGGRIGDRFVCMISPDNAPSIRLAERVGFKPFDVRSYRGSDTHLFAREGVSVMSPGPID
jgi:RimJ/RimL family protein N-acetyltransferase